MVRDGNLGSQGLRHAHTRCRLMKASVSCVLNVIDGDTYWTWNKCRM